MLVRKKSMLILAKGKDEYLNREVKLVKTIDEAKRLYGENSQLAEAYEEAMSVGNKNINIYTCNVYKYTDYIAVLKIIPGLEFDYIAPCFDLLDKFKSINGKSYYLAELYSNTLLDQVGEIIITGNHASEYEDIQHFIDSTNSIINTFKRETNEKMVFDTNLSFVTNNIKNKKYANVNLASLLLQSVNKEYPAYAGDAIFELSIADFNDNECIFFNKISPGDNNIVPSNLVNFTSTKDFYKSILNNSLRRELLKRLDMSSYKGRLYSNHVKVIIENKVKSIISSAVGELIEDGKLISIISNIHKDREVELICKVLIKPFYFSEYIEISGGI